MEEGENDDRRSDDVGYRVSFGLYVHLRMGEGKKGKGRKERNNLGSCGDRLIHLAWFWLQQSLNVSARIATCHVFHLQKKKRAS